MITRLSFLPVVQVTQATIVPIEYDEITFTKFQANFIDTNDVSHDGTVYVDFMDPVSSGIQPLARGSLYSPSVEIRAVSIGDNLVTLSFDRNYHLDIRGPAIRFSANPDQIFSNRAIVPPQGYLFVPTSSTTGSLVIDPQAPSVFALDGEMFYTRPNPTSFFREWKVETAIRLVDNEEDNVPTSMEFHSCSLHGGHMGPPSVDVRTRIHNQQMPFLVPVEVQQGVFRRLRELGISYAHNSMLLGFRLDGFTEAHFDSMPKIQYIMRTDDERLVNLIVLEPREYIKIQSDNQYVLKLKSLGGEMFSRSSCFIHHTMLQKLVVHIDPHNYRVGFGEPIVEL